MAIVDRVRDLVGSVVADSGADLYDVEFDGGVLRILVDREGGIGIDTIKTISRAAARILDEADPISSRYTLEVSSPGLERPLRTEDHFQKATGELVKLKTYADVDGERRFAGTVVGADADGVSIDVDGTERRFAYDQLAKARTVFEWGPTPKPGQPNSSKNRSTKPGASSARTHPDKEATPS